MQSIQLRFSEFIDLLLVRLYELDREQGSRLFQLEEISKEIRQDVPSGWAFDAAKVLESRGLAECIYTFGGTEAQLTGEGRLYVEEGRGITKEAQQNPNQYFNINVSGANSQVAIATNASTVTQQTTIEQSPIYRSLDEAKKIVTADKTLQGEERTEALTYLGLLQQQLKKPEPNRSLIAAVLDPLSKIASIAGCIANFVRYFNAMGG